MKLYTQLVIVAGIKFMTCKTVKIKYVRNFTAERHATEIFKFLIFLGGGIKHESQIINSGRYGNVYEAELKRRGGY